MFVSCLVGGNGTLHQSCLLQNSRDGVSVRQLFIAIVVETVRSNCVVILRTVSFSRVMKPTVMFCIAWFALNGHIREAFELG